MNSRSPRDREPLYRGARLSAEAHTKRWRALLSLALCAAACGPGRAAGPERLVRSYLAAIRADDAKRAYGLVASSVRKRMTESEFVAGWRTLKPELLSQAELLAARLDKPIIAEAKVEYQEGASARLRFEDGWRIDTGVSVAPPTTTPLEALAALVHAMERHDFDRVLKLLARPLRKSIQGEADDRVKKLRDWLNKEPEIEVTGDRARVRYDPRYRIELVNEEGQWRVIDYD